MKEQYYDELLNIKTRDIQKGFHSSLHFHRYEPTPYDALETLFRNYKLERHDRVVDFGCGKGRLVFYIHHFFRATVIGVEMNEAFYQEAVANRIAYLKKYRNIKENIQFHHCLAQDYPIDPQDNRFYFFNPFSIQVFMTVINSVLVSVEKFKRDIELILYYPSEDYIYYLEHQTAFEILDEIRLPMLYERNPHERFLIYRLAY